MLMMRLGIGADQGGADNLHVAGQHDQLHALFAHQRQLGGFRGGLGGRGHGENVEGQAELFGQRAQGFVVAEDQRDVGVPFPGAMPREQIVQAVRFAADPQGEAGAGAW
jgi:hypothetical protein